MRSSATFFSGAALALIGLVTGGCGEANRPNVLLISLDACRARNLGSYGYARETSPFLDEIAAGGVRFANAFVNTLGTTPSHTTMLTSLYQETHRVEYEGGVTEPAEDRIPDEATLLQEILSEHGYVSLAVTDGGQMAGAYGFSRGFTEFHDDGGGVIAGTKKLSELIREHLPGERPIFAFYHTYEIHSPYFPPPEYIDEFGDFDSDLVLSSENLLESVRTAREDLSEEDLEYAVAAYDAGIRFTDDALRSLFVELEAMGFFENYLVVITSDHGEEFAEHGGLLHRGLLYDELLHVPLVLAGDDIPEGRVDERLASSVDVATTILAHAGVPIPETMQGTDLLAADGDAEPSPDAAVMSQIGDFRFSIRTDRWKLIENHRRQTLELYDLSEDPGERTNLAEERLDVRGRLRTRLREWRNGLDVIESDGGEVELTQEELERLESLGYVSGDERPRR